MPHKKLIQKLGFTPKENSLGIFQKKYANAADYCLEIDFENQKINFGDKITAESKTTQNFTQTENWVVLECVDRLLEKGYQPQNITLEKTWATGHGTSGRLDIFVSHNDGSAYLMIECKTYGAEFDKAFKRLLSPPNGGQLFTYFQQDKHADVLMLYASELNSAGELRYRNEIINIEESYRDTSNVGDFYQCWNKLPKNNGVFESWVTPYDFQSKALTPKNLKDITQEDSSFIFNQFLEILRHNVVSDKPNAFNKIFTLFLCKIYDEKTSKPNDELAFQWFYTPYQYNGITYPPDDDVSFQKRLTDLYKKGMWEFLEKRVTDISDAEFEKKYASLDEKTRNLVLNELTEIRLKKNNEFAIKEVFDDDSFAENAKVVKEVVELLQGFKIRYTKKQQYLSDFFELLLTTGLKQESGQFFTPVPIAQFIIKSLPLNQLVAKKLASGESNSLLPTVIDYAAGSGHFITESMHEIQRIIDNTSPDDFIDSTAKKLDNWKNDHFEWALQYVYGIEKDYRLVKVGKVGCYLHGDGLAQIIHSDGLANFANSKDYKGLLKKSDSSFPKENKQFDIVVSNPPYSVSAFKNNASKYYAQNDFVLYDKLTDQSSEIECLFVERMQQLLKDGGLAGVILPSSILSNTGIYTATREMILQYFEIIAITELGSNTFMATATNTVVLFLRRRNNYDSINLRASVTKAINNAKDVTLNGIEKALSHYVAQVWEGLTLADYLSLLQKQPVDALAQHEIYQEYLKWKADKKLSDAAWWDKVIALETEKLFYFVLTYPQTVVLVKTGEKNAEKEFLGYEFSNRRGDEGIHPLQRGKNIDECTKLFDPEIFDNPEKASTYIYQAFLGDLTSSIHPSLSNNISRVRLADMLTFNRGVFEKNISTSVKKKVTYETLWKAKHLKYLADVAEIRKGTSITEASVSKGEIPVIAGGKTPAYYHNQSNRDGTVITISASGANAGFVNYFETPIFASDCNTIQSNNEKIISTKLLFHFLSFLQPYIYALQRGQAQPHVYAEDLKKIQIPLPPLEIQQKIVDEIKALENQEKNAKVMVDQLMREVKAIISNINAEPIALSKITSKIGSGATPIGGEGSYKKTGTPLIRSQNIYDGSFYEKGLAFIDDAQAEKLKNVTVEKNDILFNITGASIARCCIAPNQYLPARVNQHVAIIRVTQRALPKYVQAVLVSDVYKIQLLEIGQGATSREALTKQQLEDFKIPLLPLEIQKKIVANIEKIEADIAAIEEQVAKIPAQKEAILHRYLN